MLQAYSPEVLAMFADRVPADTAVTILHHLGLPDERLVSMSARELPTFREADHLTSVYIPQLRGAAVAVNELIELMIRLRRDCAWDQEQTHESLARHLIEEAYETIDALNNYSAALESGEGLESAAYDAEEELGDLLFQIVFHAHLGTEEDAFSLETIADHVHNKLVARHPHVFGDVEVANATDAESRWENLKKAEKSRESVTDGIAWDLPGFVLHAKLQRKAHSVGAGDGDRDEAVASLRTALGELTHNVESSDAWEQVVRGLSVLARHVGVDIENVARREALALRDEIRRIEGLS
jgi:tetrapyrrole methylase family protein/MazG family protein